MDQDELVALVITSLGGTSSLQVSGDFTNIGFISVMVCSSYSLSHCFMLDSWTFAAPVAFRGAPELDISHVDNQ